MLPPKTFILTNKVCLSHQTPMTSANLILFHLNVFAFGTTYRSASEAMCGGRMLFIKKRLPAKTKTNSYSITFRSSSAAILTISAQGRFL